MQKIFFLLFSFIALTAFGQKKSSSEKILPNTVILKVKSQYRTYCSAANITHTGINKILQSSNAETTTKEFPNHFAPKIEKNINGIPLADISLIYKMVYSGNQKVRDVAAKLMSTGYFEYAEPFFLHELQFNPDDPEIGSQHHITNINAYQAWDTQKGDTAIVMGISDTGIELTHPDIVGAIKYNYNDPINGIDDDGDGYIDNFYGWDLGTNDNDPSWNVSKHGHSVSGTAGASTNNANQVAGVGYKTKLMPLKISNNSQQLVGSYSSIIYAADHGCNIINCSWGTVNSWSQAGQDVITYAAINKNCLVVCAAGNSNNEGQYYPASFDFALSVGGTNSSNAKWVSSASFGSNYNEHVDICAPGHDIFTITTGGATISGRAGTSFAAPIVSGAAGLVWGADLTYTGMQVGEILKATADSLELIPGNAAYTGKLGEGLLNCERSVTESGFPGLYMYDFTFTGNNQGKFAIGDTVTVSSTIVNYLTASSTGTNAVISTTSSHIQMVTSTVNIGAISGAASLNLAATPFKFVILPTMPVGETIGFVFTMTDGTYNTKRYTEQDFNIDYVDITENQIGTSVGASGKFGYNELGAQQSGLGYTYKGSSSLLYHMGLIVTDNSSQVSYVLDGDFQTESLMNIQDPGSESDFDVHTNFNDSAATSPLSISVKQKTLAWGKTAYEDFVILEYKIFNKGATPYTNLHVGVYADWDIGAVTNNEAALDNATKTAYCNEIGGVFAGVHLMDTNNIHHYAYENDGANGSASIYDGYTETEQFTHLTGGNSRPTAASNDVSHLIGNGPFTLNSGDSLVFAIAVLAGDDLPDLLNNVLQSDTAYREIREIDITTANVTQPNCKGSCNGSITITSTGGVGSHTYLWNDATAQTTATASSLCAGVYSCTVTDSIGQQNVVSGITITDSIAVVVSLGNDTTLCSGASVTFDAQNSGSTYLWSDASTSQTLVVSGAGNINVRVITPAGCIARDTVNVFTGTTPTVNIGRDSIICSGQSLALDAGNPGLIYLWNTGASTQTLATTVTDTYWVKVTNFSGCSDADSAVITVENTPAVALGTDIIACNSYSGILDAGNPGSTYLWSTGVSTQTISVNTTGQYYVTATSPNLCVGKDTINITIEVAANVNLGNDTAVCRNGGFTLDAGIASTYLWSNGATSQTIPVYFEGEYFVTAGNNCLDKDTVNVTFLADPTVYYLSSFNTAVNSNNGDVLLNFGEPVGGVYSGTAVTGNFFNTITSGDGLFQVNYTFTDPTSGCSASTWVTMDVNPTNSTIQINGEKIEVYPNPFNDHILLEFSASTLENLNYSLYDGKGRLVNSDAIGSSIGNLNYRINTSDLIPGVYHLVLNSDEFYQAVKVVK